MDGQKPHVEISSPILSDGSAWACCLPWAMVQAERKAAPSVLGCQLVPQHWNRGSACAREVKTTSLLPTVWGISSCALSQQQRNIPQKQIKLRCFFGIKLRYFVGNGSTSPLPAIVSALGYNLDSLYAGIKEHPMPAGPSGLWPLCWEMSQGRPQLPPGAQPNATYQKPKRETTGRLKCQRSYISAGAQRLNPGEPGVNPASYYSSYRPQVLTVHWEKELQRPNLMLRVGAIETDAVNQVGVEQHNSNSVKFYFWTFKLCKHVYLFFFLLLEWREVILHNIKQKWHQCR